MAKILARSKKLLNHPLAKGGLIVFIGNFLANIFNYLFHLLTGRLLKPEKYSVIASLISLFYVISFPSGIINTIVTRKTASLAAKKDWGSIKTVFKFLLKNVAFFNLLLLAAFFPLQRPVARFLKIEEHFLVFLLALTFALSLLSTVVLAVLQGLLKFFRYSFLNALTSLLRVCLATGAILLGLNIAGVMWSMVATSLISFFISIYFLKFIFAVKETKRGFHFQSYFSTFWVVVAFLGMSLLINGDVMLVKHFFPSFEAGLYAALATMGKVVFFASSSISTVFLPWVATKKEIGVSSKRELFFSQLVIFLISSGLVIVYFLKPELMITIFYGRDYLRVAPYLGLMGIYFLFYNLAYLFLNFFIAIQQKKVLVLPLVFAFGQVSLIYFFHKTFYQILTVMISMAALLFLSFSLYYLRSEKIKA